MKQVRRCVCISHECPSPLSLLYLYKSQVSLCCVLCMYKSRVSISFVLIMFV
ncbi:hypothetical protein N665_1436s0010 [Sinapis alba]|nr:hypothetical protein N665_1436s0010 [Sinapis alba]